MAKKAKTLLTSPLVDRDVHWDVCVESNSDKSHCECEGICRCSIITSAHVTEVCISTLVSGYRKKLSEIDEYCIDRILRANKVYDTSKYDIAIRNSYYGQEIGRVTLDRKLAEICDREVNQVLNLKTVSAKVKHILSVEYGYLLPGLDSLEFNRVKVRKVDVHYGQPDHAAAVYRKLTKEGVDFYRDYLKDRPEAICGVCTREPTEVSQSAQYRLIDGYHRCAAAERDSIWMLVGY